MIIEQKAPKIKMFNQWQCISKDNETAWWGHEYDLGYAVEALIRYLDIKFYKDGELYTEKEFREISGIRNRGKEIK